MICVAWFRISLHNSLINASAGQATLDLNSLQQQLLYSKYRFTKTQFSAVFLKILIF